MEVVKKMLSKRNNRSQGRFIKGIQRRNIFLGSFFMTIICLVVVGYFLYIEIPKQKAAVLDEYMSNQAQLEKVFMLAEGVSGGGELTQVVVEKEVRSDEIPTDALTSIDGSRVAKIEMTANTIITKSNTVSKSKLITDDLRRETLQGIDIPEDLTIGSYVDVKYFDTDEDRVILSKKEVLMISSGKLWFNLNDNESYLYKQAMKERMMIGGSIYVSTYIDPHNQRAADISYRPMDDNRVEEEVILDEEERQHDSISGTDQ